MAQEICKNNTIVLCLYLGSLFSWAERKNIHREAFLISIDGISF